MTLSNGNSSASRENQWLHKKLLAIDYGEKFTGLAKFQIGRDPFPHPAGRIDCNGNLPLLEKIHAFVSEEEIEIIVLGIPTLLDGKETTMTRKVRQFGEALRERFPELPVYFQDETLSTYEAGERMKSSPRYNFKVCLEEIDALAATIILEDFLKTIGH